MQSLAIQSSDQDIMLTVDDVKKLKNCSKQYVHKLIASGELHGEKRLNERNRPTYYIPLSSLDAKEQTRYHKQHGISGQVIELPQRNAKPLDSYSLHERAQIHFWLDLLDEWQLYRNKPIHASRAAADANFVTYALVKYIEEFQSLYDRPFTLSTDTLYRRWRAYKDKDYDGLIEKRGKPLKGVTTMQDIVWDCFLSFYLDQAQYSIQKCYEYTQMWLQEKQPELLETLPTYSTFYRRVQNDIPEPLEVLGRKGEKAYRDRCAPYIRRIYDDMESNDYWVGDTYTLDTMSLDENGNEHRRYLVAFFDARSGVIVGWHITTQPSSQATLIALRKAILKYGIPKNVYVDNGREFLTFDLGGLGHRKKKLKNDAERFEPPAIFQRLGITMVNALVRNARAKVIERRFRDVKEHIARLFPSYTGGNIMERPEQLKGFIKSGNIPTDSDLIQIVDELMDGYFNQQEYHGAVSKDDGKTRMQVYHDNLHTKRVASIDDLNLMLMRSSRPQKVGRRGIHHKIGDIQIDFWNQELVTVMFGKEVYYRYDPDNLSEVRVYDLEDRFLMSVPADSEAIRNYGCSQDELKIAAKKVRQVEKTQKEALKNSGLAAYDRISALDLVLNEARRNAQRPAMPVSDPKVYQLEQVTERPLLENAVGFDIDTMIQNAERRYEGGTDNE